MRIPHCLRLLALIVSSATVSFGQAPVKESTGSISGNVTMGGKPAAGITVVATLNLSFFDNKTVAKAITDDAGNYKLTKLPAGKFNVMPMTKAYVVATGAVYKQAGQTVNLTDAEAATKVDFALVRGGVITGRITDSEGHPIIGERVTIAPKDSKPDVNSQMAMLGGPRNQTDDRGIYRAYGLGPGSYKVSVGQSAAAGGAVSIMGMGGSQYLKTFYPGVQDDARATIIEIKEGAEIANVDITVSKPGSGFSASGRVVDADSGQPVPNLYIGHSPVNEASQTMEGMGFSGNQTDANGKFRLEGLRPGKYAVFTFAVGQANTNYSEPAPFEISDGDVTGLEVKVRRGGSISGVAVIENSSDPAAVALLQTVTVATSIQAKGLAAPSYASSQIAADGSFRFNGLAPGRARIFPQGFPTPPKGLTLVRTELDGLDQPDGIELTAGGNVTGVRLVFAYGTGSIRGEVKIEGGSLPEGTMLQVSLQSTSDNRRLTRATEIDGRNRFSFANLPAGNYELTLRASGADQTYPAKPEPVKQSVTVSNGAETAVTLVFDVNRKGGQ